MIFLDANFFLRYLTRPTSPKLVEMHAIAEQLIHAANRNEEEVTTSEVVLHEVVYVLGSKKQYNQPATEIVALLSPLLQMPGMKLQRGEKQLYMRALDIFATYPKLGFADSIIVARMERLGADLATFDKDLAKLDIATRWEPPRLPNN
jgi:predicted nucleic acid-binding protein